MPFFLGKEKPPVFRPGAGIAGLVVFGYLLGVTISDYQVFSASVFPGADCFEVSVELFEEWQQDLAVVVAGASAVAADLGDLEPICGNLAFEAEAFAVAKLI